MRTATATVEVEVDFDLENFETEDLIKELSDRGYSMVEEIEEQNNFVEIIETDIRGCEIKANGEVYRRGGILKITVERD